MTTEHENSPQATVDWLREELAHLIDNGHSTVSAAALARVLGGGEARCLAPGLKGLHRSPEARLSALRQEKWHENREWPPPGTDLARRMANREVA